VLGCFNGLQFNVQAASRQTRLEELDS